MRKRATVPTATEPALTLRVSPPLDADVIIVGAGPAGASAATWLARDGWRVLIIDRQRFPRDKVCGDFTGPVALAELEALGVTGEPGYLTTNVIRRAALHVDGKPLIARPIPALEGLPSYGRCIPRTVLDAWVLAAARRAGARVLEGVSARTIEVSPTCVTVRAAHDGADVSFTARMVIGADGSSSTVARALRGAPPPDTSRIVAVRGYYTGDAGPVDQADLYFSAESFPGYYWLFPTGGGTANVGVGMVLETWPPAPGHLRELMLALVERDAVLSQRLAGATLVGKIVGWPLSTYDPSLALVGDRVLLAGDAAGFINPLNGEGIQYALLSGRWAAAHAAQALLHDATSAHALAGYVAQVDRELRYDMAFAGLIVECIRNRHLNALWLQLLHVIAARARVDAKFADTCAAVLAGLVPSHYALTPHIIGRTIDQAVYSSVLSVGWSMLRGPRALVTQGQRGVSLVSGAIGGAARDPLALMRWLVGVARQAGELATQATLYRGEDDVGTAPDTDVVRLTIPAA